MSFMGDDDDQSMQSLRFHAVQLDGADYEEVEDYVSGGLHPVHLGDRYDENGRYEIVHKLGAGGFATVWLAWDHKIDVWVALKIIVARASPEIEARSIAADDFVVSSDKHSKILICIRHFNIDGPNGRHFCLVLNWLGPSSYRVSHYLESRLQPRFARRVARQAAESLAGMHADGLCHGGKCLAVPQRHTPPSVDAMLIFPQI